MQRKIQGNRKGFLAKSRSTCPLQLYPRPRNVIKINLHDKKFRAERSAHFAIRQTCQKKDSRFFCDSSIVQDVSLDRQHEVDLGLGVIG